MQKYYGEILFFIVTLFAAAGWFVSKAALAELPPAGFLGIRFMAASLLFLPFALPHFRQFSRQQIAQAACISLAFSGNIFLWIQGVAHSQHFGEGAFLLSLSMLLTPLLSWLLFRNRPARILWLSLAIAACGLALLNTVAPVASIARQFTIGAASLMGALFFVLSNQFSRNFPALPLTTIQLGITASYAAGYSLLFETWPFPLSSATYGWVIIATLLITNFRYLLQPNAQNQLRHRATPP